MNTTKCLCYYKLFTTCNIYACTLVDIFQERVRVEAAKVGRAVAGRLEERARREENSRREVRVAFIHTLNEVDSVNIRTKYDMSYT